MAICSILYNQLRLGWEELLNAPQHRTLRGALVFVLIGYIPGLGTIGLLFVLAEIIKWLR